MLLLVPGKSAFGDCDRALEFLHLARAARGPLQLVKLHSPAESDKQVEIGRTEIISNSLNPQFVTLVPVVSLRLSTACQDVQCPRMWFQPVDWPFRRLDRIARMCVGIDPR